MLGKLLAYGAGILALYEGGKWYSRHKSKHSVLQGHAYTVTLDYTGTPVAPMSQAALQAIVDAQIPGHFDVVACDMVPNAKQVACTLTSNIDEYITGDQLSTGWPTAFGTVSLDTIKDMGSAGAGTALAPLA